MKTTSKITKSLYTLGDAQKAAAATDARIGVLCRNGTPVFYVWSSVPGAELELFESTSICAVVTALRHHDDAKAAAVAARSDEAMARARGDGFDGFDVGDKYNDWEAEQLAMNEYQAEQDVREAAAASQVAA